MLRQVLQSFRNGTGSVLKVLQRMADAARQSALQRLDPALMETQSTQLLDLATVERNDVLLLVLMENNGRDIQRAGPDVDQKQIATLSVRGIDVAGQLGGDLRIKLNPGSLDEEWDADDVDADDDDKDGDDDAIDHT